MSIHTKMTAKQWSAEHSIVENWLSGVKDSSANQYRTRFRRFCEYFDMTPEEFLDEAKTDRVESKTKMNKYYKHLRSQKKSSNYSAFSEFVVKSFLKYYEITVKTKRRKIARKHKRKALRKEEIRKLVEAAPYLRDKALIVLGFQTGMSISDLVGLDYEDVRLPIENNKEYHIIEYTREKEEVESTATIGKDSIDYLKRYLSWRTQRGEDLTDDSPLFTGVRDFEAQKRLSVRTAQHMMRQTIVKAGLATFEQLKKYGSFNPFAFHAVRKAFSSVAKQNGVPFEQIEMSMGHKLPYDGAYDEFTEEEMIDSFKEAEANLSISVDTRAYDKKAQDLKQENLMLKQGLEKQMGEINALKEQLQEIVSGGATKRMAIELFAQIFDTEPTETEEIYDENFAMKKKKLTDKIKAAMTELLSD